MTDPETLARLDLARAELRTTAANARAALADARRTMGPTREEIDQLQEDASSGRLGREMRELAGHVEAGETSWADVFDGTSPFKELLRDHLTRMGDEHAAEVREALDADPDFDRDETSPGV